MLLLLPRELIDYITASLSDNYASLSRLKRTCAQLNEHIGDLRARVTGAELARRLRQISLRAHNPYWNLISKYPNKKWNWSAITRSKFVTFEIISENPLYYWKWKYITCNPNVTMEMFLQLYPHIKHLESTFMINKHSAITFDDIMQRGNNINWILNSYKNITLRHLIKYPLYEWNRNLFLETGKITLQDIYTCININDDNHSGPRGITSSNNSSSNIMKSLSGDDFILLSYNPNITLQDAASTPQLPWVIDNFIKKTSKRARDMNRQDKIKLADLFIQQAQLHEDEDDISWIALSAATFITCETLLKYPALPWHWPTLSERGDITLAEKLSAEYGALPWFIHLAPIDVDNPVEFVLKRFDEPRPNLNPQMLSCGKLTMGEFATIYAATMSDNHLRNMSRNLHVGVETILASTQIPWNMKIISMRRDLTFELIEKHIDRNWSWFTLTHTMEKLTSAQKIALTPPIEGQIARL